MAMLEKLKKGYQKWKDDAPKRAEEKEAKRQFYHEIKKNELERASELAERKAKLEKARARQAVARERRYKTYKSKVDSLFPSGGLDLGFSRPPPKPKHKKKKGKRRKGRRNDGLGFSSSFFDI